MRIVGEQKGLSDQFRAGERLSEFSFEASVLVGDEHDFASPEPINQVTRDLEEGNRRAIQVQIGMGSARELGGGMRAADAAQAAIRRNEAQAIAEKERADDAFLLALLENGDLDLWVAENIFGSMSDGEIMDLVAMIEGETGQSFEDYARNILGDDMPERRAGESEADYNRRVLTAVADVVLEDDLSIRAGYENDPLARFVNGHEVTAEARAGLARLEQRGELLGTPAIIGDAAELADESTVNAVVVAAEAGDQEVLAVGRSIYDGDRASELGSEGDEAASAGLLAGFGGNAGALELASADLETQFATATTPIDEQASPDTEVRITLETRLG